MLDKTSRIYLEIYNGLDQFKTDSIERIASFKGEFLLDGNLCKDGLG